MRDVRADFPVLARNPSLVYLDSACTALKPQSVIDAEMSYYTELGACGGRSSHRLGRAVSERVEKSREAVAAFVGAKAEELVWTRNTTEGLNIVANSLDYSKRRKVVTTVMEHHSVLLPFMRLRERGAIDLKILGCDSEGTVPMEAWKDGIGRDAALVVTHSWNNTTGTGQDVRGIARLAHDAGALACIDGAQGVPHHRSDSREADFLCFSGHKMLGPSGIGAMVAKKDLIGKMQPLMSGGGTVKTVSLERGAELMPDQSRFEAGVQHYSGMMGFEAACAYLKRLGMDQVEAHEKEMASEMREALLGAGATLYGPQSGRHGALYSFRFKKARPHDVALLLDKEGIAVRSGFFCAQPAMEALGAKDGAARASAYIYNTKDDARKLGEALAKFGALYD